MNFNLHDVFWHWRFGTPLKSDSELTYSALQKMPGGYKYKERSARRGRWALGASNPKLTTGHSPNPANQQKQGNTKTVCLFPDKIFYFRHLNENHASSLWGRHNILRAGWANFGVGWRMKPFEKWGNHRTHSTEGVRMPRLAGSHSSFTQRWGARGTVFHQVIY